MATTACPRPAMLARYCCSADGGLGGFGTSSRTDRDSVRWPAFRDTGHWSGHPLPRASLAAP
jgi:hypothetical protein